MTRSIYKKILEAQKAINYVAKNGNNTFHKYQYAMEADILDTVKKAVNEAGLVLLTSTSAEIGSFSADKIDYNGNKTTEITRWAHVTLSYKVVDADSGEKEEGTFNGYAEDKGDKAIYKATTGANKYFLMKFFGVATGDDPEKEEEKPTRPALQPPAQQRPVQQGQRQPAQRQSAPNLQAVGEPGSGPPGVDPETKNRSEKAANAICQMIAKKEFTVEEIAHHTQLSDIGATRRAFDYVKLEDALEKLNIIKSERQMAS